jgi:hypothetical protein
VSERIEWRQLDEGSADRLSVLSRDLLAGGVLGRWQVGSCRRVGQEQALADRIAEQFAQRDDYVADGSRRLAVRLELGDE